MLHLIIRFLCIAALYNLPHDVGGPRTTIDILYIRSKVLYFVV